MNNAIRQFSAEGKAGACFVWMWLGQGGFAYRFGEVTIVIDPYLSDAVTSIPRAYLREAEPSDIAGDLLLTTHDHDDHFDPETVEQAVAKGILIGGPPSCHGAFQKMMLPEECFIEWEWNRTIDFLGISITAVKAEHEGLTDALGYILHGAGVSVYHVGDCESTEEIMHQTMNLKPDLIVVPINGKWGNMNAHEAALLVKSTGAKAAIPMHYDLFVGNQEDPERFLDEIHKLGISCKPVKPERWILNGLQG